MHLKNTFICFSIPTSVAVLSIGYRRNQEGGGHDPEILILELCTITDETGSHRPLRNRVLFVQGLVIICQARESCLALEVWNKCACCSLAKTWSVFGLISNNLPLLDKLVC